MKQMKWLAAILCVLVLAAVAVSRLNLSSQKTADTSAYSSEAEDASQSDGAEDSSAQSDGAEDTSAQSDETEDGDASVEDAEEGGGMTVVESEDEIEYAVLGDDSAEGDESQEIDTSDMEFVDLE